MKRLALPLALLLLWSARASAQTASAVMEVGANLWQNTITAIEAVAQTANQLKDLLPIDAMTLAGGFDQTVTDVAALVNDADAVGYDIQSLQSQIAGLFHMETHSQGTRALLIRQRNMRYFIFAANSYALRTQTLLRTALRTIRDVQRLNNRIMALVGNQQANQTLIQSTNSMAETLTKLQISTTAYQRADSLERMAKDVEDFSKQQIMYNVLADYPGGNPGVDPGEN